MHYYMYYTASTEIKKKLYGSILLVGGGLAFPGAANLLQTRLELKLPVVFSRGSDNIEVFSNPRVSEGMVHSNTSRNCSSYTRLIHDSFTHLPSHTPLTQYTLTLLNTPSHILLMHTTHPHTYSSCTQHTHLTLTQHTHGTTLPLDECLFFGFLHTLY